MNPRVTADALEATLRAVGTPERAAGERAYLKSDYEHLGATVPALRRHTAALARQHRDLGHDELIALATELWRRPVFECRFAAGLLLQKYSALVRPDDLDLLRRLIGDSYTWALVDLLATDVLGTLLIAYPDAAEALDTWVTDPDFWIRRAALISQLKPLRTGAAEFARFARYADAMLDEREFFIRKAIGWVLRDIGKRDPATVYEWLKPRIDRASGVTVREAVKYLPEPQRDELRAAYKERGRPHGAPSSGRKSRWV